MQAIARVNRTYGKDKTCGYVVDYVGITQHLKEALSEYASLEGVSEEDKDPMLSVAEDIDRLNRTRDPRYSMKDASVKVRAIIEEYLTVNGVGVEVPPIDILSPDFITGIEKPDKTDRAIVDELEYAVREYIIENTPRDPELFERFSEHLNEILETLKGNWKELRKALESFIKVDLYNARNAENTYGYETVKEMPFFSLLRKEVFGDKKFEDLTGVEFNALKLLTDDCLSLLKTNTANRDFWAPAHDMQIRQLRAEIRTKLFDIEVTAPSISNKINDIVQKIIELGREHYK